MKKIKDFFTSEYGFFTELQTFNQELYTKLFDNYSAVMLNINFLSICGNRYISPIVSVAGNVSILTAIICSNYSDAWIKIKNALLADYEPLKPVKISITTDKELQSDKNTNNENTENSYLYPFNENSEGVSESINEGKNEVVTVNTVANTERLSQTVTREGISNAKPTDLIRAEIQTRKITFLSLVMNDIKEFCTLQIYE